MNYCISNSVLGQGGYSEAQQFGATGERIALNELQRRGYNVSPISDWSAEADLCIFGSVPVLVEVKVAHCREFWNKNNGGRWRRRKRWSWEVNRIPRNIDMIVMLIAIDQDGVSHPFVLPSWAIAGRGWPSVIHLASDPLAYVTRGRGWLAEYYQQWSTVEQVIATRAKFQSQAGQLTLWGNLV